MASTRDFGWAYEPMPDVDTPNGSLNTGYVTSTAGDGAAHFARGTLPDMHSDTPVFALSAPVHGMREPGTTRKSYPSIATGPRTGTIAGG